MSLVDVTIERNEKGQIIPGQTGGLNPKGRPRGSRSKLGEAFVADLQEAWQLHGNSVIQRVIDERPSDFLKIVANILPKDVNIKVNSTEDLSDEQLMRKLAALTEMARPLLARITDGAHVEPQRNPEPVVDVDYVDISKG
jgi:hypothetical protein